MKKPSLPGALLLAAVVLVLGGSLAYTFLDDTVGAVLIALGFVCGMLFVPAGPLRAFRDGAG